MREINSSTIGFPAASHDVLTELLRRGDRRVSATAVEAEVEDWIVEREHRRGANGRRQVARNGHLARRKITIDLGQVELATADPYN